MAGDWMKMEKVTPEKPEVMAMADELGLDPDAVFGKLFRIWAWFDDHTSSGCARRVTPAQLDRKAGVTGFASSMLDVEWLAQTNDGLQLPKFDRHNGTTGKTRALAAKRMAKQRCAPSATEAQPEKRREEKSKDRETGVRFVPPTVSEIVSYAKSQGKEIDAQAFWNFYEAKGWMIGKNKMARWKACVAGWISRNENRQNHAKANGDDPRGNLGLVQSMIDEGNLI